MFFIIIVPGKPNQAMRSSDVFDVIQTQVIIDATTLKWHHWNHDF